MHSVNTRLVFSTNVHNLNKNNNFKISTCEDVQ
jgi:hypothetical protein